MKTRKLRKRKSGVACDLYLDSVIDNILHVIYANQEEHDDRIPEEEYDLQRDQLASYIGYSLVHTGFVFADHNASSIRQLKPTGKSKKKFPKLQLSVSFDWITSVVTFDILDGHIDFESMSDDRYNVFCAGLRNAMSYMNLCGCTAEYYREKRVEDMHKYRNAIIVNPDKCYSVIGLREQSSGCSC